MKEKRERYRVQILKRRFKRTQSPQPQPTPRPGLFTDDQIRERAYQLWRADPQGSAESHWEAAIKQLQRERSLGWQVKRTLLKTWWLPGEKGLRSFPGNVYQVIRLLLRFFWRLPGNVVRVVSLAFTVETPSTALDLVKVVISAFGVLATIFAGVGLYLTYQNTRQEQQLNTERLVTDRFAKAVEQLGSPDIDVRIGGIYSLERIAKDSPKDHWTIMEVLTAFVRNKSPLPKDWKPNSKQELQLVTTDVQSALTVIGRREVKNDPERQRLDLSKTNLGRANLSGANLSDAHLSGADLSGANLTEANLFLANLRGANLLGANLFLANLWDANLRGADLGIADLYGANLNSAYLNDANLSGAQNLTPTQIKAAEDWQDAHYSPDFRQQLGLPPEKPKP